MTYNKLIIILFFLLFSLSSFAICRNDQYKIINIKDLHERSYETFSNGSFKIELDDPNAEIIDYYDSRGRSYGNGIIITKKTDIELDSRNKILKYFFPKILKEESSMIIELTQNAISQDVLGRSSLPLHFLMKYKNTRLKFKLTFNNDLSDNCRATGI